MSTNPADVVEALEAELSSFLDIDDSDRPALESAVVTALQDAVSFNDSKADPYAFLYGTLRITSEDGSRSSTFTQQPSPAALWTTIAADAAEGDHVSFTVASPHGQREVADVWPFGLGIAEEMSRPAAPYNTEKQKDDETMSMRRIGRLKVFWGTRTGPPTWRLPKARVSFKRGFYFQGGWLQRLVFIGVISDGTAAGQTLS